MGRKKQVTLINTLCPVNFIEGQRRLNNNRFLLQQVHMGGVDLPTTFAAPIPFL